MLAITKMASNELTILVIYYLFKTTLADQYFTNLA